MIAISVNDLTLRFGTTTILEKVSFSLEENDKLGIIGSNGSGKTSLFKLICGEYDPEEGEVFISKGKTVGILSQYGAFSDADGGTALDHMFAAFPTLLEWEKRLSELEALLNDHSDSEKHRINTNEYMALNDRFIRDGGLEFRGRCRSILQKLGFDDDAIIATAKCFKVKSTEKIDVHLTELYKNKKFDVKEISDYCKNKNIIYNIWCYSCTWKYNLDNVLSIIYFNRARF